MLQRSSLLILLSVAFLPICADVVLVENGAAHAGIRFDTEYKTINKHAQVLQDYIRKSSGAVLPINEQISQTAIKLEIAPERCCR